MKTTNHLYLQYIAYKTLARKEITRFLRIWKQTLIPPAITVTLYFIIFGSFLGSQLAPIQGYTYMEFIVPGLILLSVITSSFSNVAASFFGAKFQKNIEEVLVAPLSPITIISSYITAGVLRGIIVGCIIYLISLFFSPLFPQHYGFLIFFLLVTAVTFSLAGMINGIFAKKFDDIAFVPTFILTPLIYLGGIFYSLERLSPFWKSVSYYNPLLYMINGFRYSILGISDVSITSAVFLLLIFFLGCFIASYYLILHSKNLRS